MENIGMYIVSERNVNCILTYLYQERDKIGSDMDRFITRPEYYKKLDDRYQDIVDIISSMCDFRRRHHNCLTEGDIGYGFQP